MPVPRFARWLVVAATAATAFGYTTRAADPINILKLTIALYASAALVAAGAVAAVRTRSVAVPAEPVVAAAGFFLLAAGVAAAAAPDLGTAVLGQYQRNTGLLLYGSAAIVLVAVVVAFEASDLELLVRSLLAVGAGLTLYGLFQAADMDPVPWSNPYGNRLLVTLGNPNFASAYLGILVPIAAYGAIRRVWSRRWRVASAVLALLMFGLAVYSNAAQGPLCAIAGLAVVALAWLLDAPARTRRLGIAALTATSVGGAALVVAAAAGLSPSARLEAAVSARPRQWYWEAGARMFADRPWRGIGLDSYGGFYRAFRPEEATRTLGGTGFADSAHSVPLSMFTWGGVLLGLAYLVLLGVVAVSLVFGLRRYDGQRRLLIGGLGGAWLAWVVQGLVSIDQVPLTMLGWVLCGATVVAARRSAPPQRWVLSLAGAPSGKNRAAAQARPGASSKKGAKRRPPTRPRRRPWTAVDRVAVASIGGLALLAVWFASVPLRADVAARRGDEAVSAQRAVPALSAYRAAVELGPWRAAYWSRLGQIYEIAQRPELAWTAYRSGAQNDPRVIDVLQPAARLAVQLGHTDEAARLFRQLYEVDPDNPGTLTPYAAFLVAQGEAARAVEILQEAVDTENSGSAELWKQLGDAQRAAGNAAAARAAYERALQINPNFTDAKTALDALGAGS